VRSKFFTFCIVGPALCAAAAGCGGGDDQPTEPTPVCSIVITPPNAAFSSQGGIGNVSVNAPAGCTWSAINGTGWTTVSAGGSGSGPGTVTYSVAVNTATESRSGTLTIGGQTHAISQEGRPPTICTYEISATNAEFGKDEATGTLTVTAPADCSWTAESHVSWLSVASGQQGSGTGSVSYAVARNTDSGARTGTITVAGRTFSVWQSGDVRVCEYSVVPVELRPCMPGATLSAAITTQPNCPWTASSDSAWLSVAGGSGTGSGSVSITFGDNYDAPRAGIVLVRWPTVTAGQNIHVAQAGCAYAVSRAEISVTSSGGTGTFDVIQQSDPLTCGGPLQDRCLWTAQSDVSWLVITSSMPRTGDNPVAFTIAANDGTSSRVGRIIVRDKVVVITQAGR